MSSKPGAAGRTPISTRTIQGAHLTYDISVWARDTTRSCADHAVGAKLVALLRGASCTLTRSIGTTTVNGKAIGVAQENLTLGGPTKTADATAVKITVLLTSSTNDGIDDLLHDGKRLPSGPARIPNTAPRNAINSGASVNVVRTWYLAGPTAANDPRLNEAVEDLSTT